MRDYKVGYCFDLETGEFLGIENVYLEIRTGLYPHANNVVFDAPPEYSDHEKPIRKDGKWCIVPDWRGYPIWNDDGSVGGVIDILGYAPKIKKDPPEVEDHIKLFWDEKKEDWIQTLEDGYIRSKDGTIRVMSQLEKINAGLEDLPSGYKIVDNVLVVKTLQERYNDGEITKDEYNAEIDSQRKARYKAETDSMGLRFLRGDCAMEEWQAAIDQIKKDLPKIK